MRHGSIRREHLEYLAQMGIQSEDAVIRQLRVDKVITDQDIARCREQLLEISNFTLFLWRNCYFSFKAGEMIKEGGVAVDVDSMHLIIEGTRRVDEWIQISPVVPSVYMIYRHRARPPLSPPRKELREILHRVDGKRDVAMIASMAGMT
jgi:hypothetical protein